MDGRLAAFRYAVVLGECRAVHPCPHVARTLTKREPATKIPAYAVIIRAFGSEVKPSEGVSAEL
jgi:hypothetical protein